MDAASRKAQATFHCVHCGHEANADVNAALNILALGTIGRLDAEAAGLPGL